MAVHAASAASLAQEDQEDPVRRSVAGPGETVRIDEGFQEKWSSAVSSLKILGGGQFPAFCAFLKTTGSLEIGSWGFILFLAGCACCAGISTLWSP